MDWPASIAAAAGRPRERRDLRYRRGREARASLDCFVLDCSGSMLGGGRLALAKGVLTHWFGQAVQARRAVSLVCHGGQQARTMFAPAVPRRWNAHWIEPIGGGGGTPLRQGLALALRHAAQQGRRQPGLVARLWLLTDGRCPWVERPDWAGPVTVVDFGHAGFAASGALRLAQRWQAEYLDRAALELELPD